MKLLDVYKSLLRDLNLVVNKEGYVYTTVDSEEDSGKITTVPTVIDGNRLAIPTTEILRSGKAGSLLIFHPMWEDILSGPSIIIENLRQRIIMAVEDEFALMAIKILMLSQDKKAQEKLSPDQSEILSYGKEADNETIRRMEKIVKNIKQFSRDQSFFHLYLKRGAKINGQNYRQASIINFPIYSAIKENSKKVFGVSLRVCDYNAIKGVIEFILPGIGDDNSYSFGSNSNVCPKFEALVGGFNNIMTRLIEVSNIFEDGDDSVKFYKMDKEFNMGWNCIIGNTDKYKVEVSMISNQKGNDGISNLNEEGFVDVASVKPKEDIRKPIVNKVMEESIPEVPLPISSQQNKPSQNNQPDKTNVDTADAIRRSLGFNRPMGLAPPQIANGIGINGGVTQMGPNQMQGGSLQFNNGFIPNRQQMIAQQQMQYGSQFINQQVPMQGMYPQQMNPMMQNWQYAQNQMYNGFAPGAPMGYMR